MKVGKHVIRLVLQLGHGSPGARNVDAWIGRLDALIADLRRKYRKTKLVLSIGDTEEVVGGQVWLLRHSLLKVPNQA